MYELQEDRIRRTATEAEALLAEKRARVNDTICGSLREEHRAVAHLRGEPVGSPRTNKARTGATSGWRPGKTTTFSISPTPRT